MGSAEEPSHCRGLTGVSPVPFFFLPPSCEEGGAGGMVERLASEALTKRQTFPRIILLSAWPASSMAEQLTLNQRVPSSTLGRVTS